MISAASSVNGSASGGPALAQAAAEALPFTDGAFDLVTSTVSFHQWAGQARGLKEVGRVLVPDGVFVLADLHAVGWLRAF
jgi:ubiquinone/menaquinone biosynthesis C-methylase UbiE